MFFKSGRSSSTVNKPEQAESGGLAAFTSETGAASQKEVKRDRPAVTPGQKQRVARLSLWIGMILLIGGTVAAAGTWQYKKRTASASAFLSVETSAPGLDVMIDGRPIGRTPIGTWLPPGTYDVTVGQGARQRQLTVDLAAGASVFRHFDLAPPAPSGTAAGDALSGGPQVRIETQPSAMMVSIDGVERGRSPLVLNDLATGAHDVVVRGDGRTLRNRIALRAGESTVVVFASDARTPALTAPVVAPAAGGWLAVTSPIPVQIREGGKVIGSSDLDRLMLPTGDHALEFVNEALGYESRRSVRIEPGKTAGVQLERVNGVISINALPWAEVFVNGERIGQTPIGNLSHPIGTYDVVLRHPQFGERRERVTITAKQPARLGVDMRKAK